MLTGGILDLPMGPRLAVASADDDRTRYVALLARLDELARLEEQQEESDHPTQRTFCVVVRPRRRSQIRRRRRHVRADRLIHVGGSRYAVRTLL